MRRIAIVSAALALLMSLGGAASAQGSSPVRHEPGDPAHSHHVHTGNGGCVDIDSVLFMPTGNGLHQGSNASSLGNPNAMDTTRGPFHGTCDDH